MDLMNFVAAEIPGKWREVAIGLGLDFPDIHRIEANNPTNNPYVAVFDTWKNNGAEEYTWKTLLNVLRTPSVNAQKLASIVESQLAQL